MASELRMILSLLLRGDIGYTCFPALATKSQSKPSALTPSGGLTGLEPP